MSDFFADEKRKLQKLASARWLCSIPCLSILLLVLAIVFDSHNRIMVAGSLWAYCTGVLCFFVAMLTLFVSWYLLISKQEYLREYKGKKDKYVYLPSFFGHLFLIAGYFFLNANTFSQVFENGQWEHIFKALIPFLVIMPFAYFLGYSLRTNYDYSGSVRGTIVYLIYSLIHLLLYVGDAFISGYRWTSVFEVSALLLYFTAYGFFFSNVTIDFAEKNLTQKPQDVQLEYLRRIDERTSSIDLKVDEISQGINALTSNILKRKEEFANDCFRIGSLTEEQLEIMRADFVNDIAGSVIDTVYKESASVDYEESLLKGMFGSHWKMLDEYTKKALISAKVFFKNCSGMAYAGLDHSGIIVSASSALENELKRRIFLGFQQFLQKKYGAPSCGKWPEIMTYRDSNGKIIPNNSFSLGTFKHILKLNGRGETDLQEYISSILSNRYRGLGLSAFTDKGNGYESFKTRCENVRLTYRNAAAHTEPVNRAQAEACCNDIIGPSEASEKIGQVQGLLYDLVQMTENFK